MDGATPILVYDQPNQGHFRRGVEVLAKVLDGRPMLVPIRKAWRTLVLWNGTLVCGTIKGYLRAFLVVGFLRHILGRRTVGVIITDPRAPSTKWGRPGWRRRVLEYVLRRPNVKVLSILQSSLNDISSEDFIYDPEWWDLSVAPLPEHLPPGLPSKPAVLFIGTPDRNKAVDFFVAAAVRVAELRRSLRFVFCADRTSLRADLVADFERAGGIFLPPCDDDGQFVSLIRWADWTWCCYEPSRDVSSGILGRTFQFGTRSIVRKGSYLERCQAAFGSGVAVALGDVDGLLAALMSHQPDPARSAPIATFAEISVRRLRQACGARAFRRDVP